MRKEKGITLNKFREKCIAAKMKIIGRADIDGAVIMVADGHQNGTAEMPEPHFRTVYAVGPSVDDLRIMQSVYHKFFEGFGMSTKQEERVQDAFEQGKDAAEKLKHGGLFKD